MAVINMSWAPTICIGTTAPDGGVFNGHGSGPGKATVVACDGMTLAGLDLLRGCHCDRQRPGRWRCSGVVMVAGNGLCVAATAIARMLRADWYT